ncbi:MAG: type II secretion system F family protein, partial [Actinomycetota bacterium]
CWSVAHGTGAGLAESLRRAVSADREDDEVRTQLAAHLAAPRATARMLAGLPVLGLILGIAMGGDPLAWLLGTPLGFGCLACGIGLTILGLLWTSRIAARVEALL